MKKLVTLVLLVSACLAASSLMSGCARRLGPHATSTAAPPALPERPEPLPPVIYHRTVREVGMPFGRTMRVY